MTNLLLRLISRPTRPPPSIVAPRPALTHPAGPPRPTIPPRLSGDCSARYAPSFSAYWAYSGVVKDHIPIQIRIQKHQKRECTPIHLPTPSLAGFAALGNGNPIYQVVSLSIQIFLYHRIETAAMQKLLLSSLCCPRADSLINPTLCTDLSPLPHFD